MEVKWTKEQQDAIYEKGSNILVAAAAGSGKTAVLVERIIDKIITQKIDIDKLLVVTFTNSAAAEMRERVLNAIYQKLEQDPENQNLQKQTTLLNKASICTIDSFCLEIVHNHFYELDNISPNFRIADSTQIDLLKLEVLEELFEKKYEEQEENFLKLITTYTSYRDDTPLKELILKIDTYRQSNPFPDKWLKEKIQLLNRNEAEQEDFATTIWGQVLLQELEEALIDAIAILQDVKKQLSQEPELDKFEQVIRSDIEGLTQLKNNLNDWDESYHIAQNFQFITWPRKKIESDLKEEAKQIRDDVKKRITKKIQKILVGTSKEANQDLQDMYEILIPLQNIILEFEQEFSRKKRERNIVDFHDIEHFALTLLVKEDENGEIIPTEIARKYQEKFEEIAIDEYQDSNLVQEYILNAVSRGNNLFMVGDVKQSIYKFRQAMPELFLSKYATYASKEEKQPSEALKIKLFKNFRSRENVLDFTNLIFENIMSSKLGDIDYRQDEFLNLGASYEPSKQDYHTQIMIVDLKETGEEKEEQETQENQEEMERIENTRIRSKTSGQSN